MPDSGRRARTPGPAASVLPPAAPGSSLFGGARGPCSSRPSFAQARQRKDRRPCSGPTRPLRRRGRPPERHQAPAAKRVPASARATEPRGRASGADHPSCAPRPPPPTTPSGEVGRGTRTEEARGVQSSSGPAQRGTGDRLAASRSRAVRTPGARGSGPGPPAGTTTAGAWPRCTRTGATTSTRRTGSTCAWTTSSWSRARSSRTRSSTTTRCTRRTTTTRCTGTPTRGSTRAGSRRCGTRTPRKCRSTTSSSR